MRHVGFRELVLLAASGVPWPVACAWSAARRRAALAIIAEHAMAEE